MTDIDYYDPDDVFLPDRSPALKAIDLRLLPDLYPKGLHAVKDATDSFDLNTPWAPELRISGPSPFRTANELPSPVDGILLNLMDGRNFEVGEEAQRQLLKPIKLDYGNKVNTPMNPDTRHRTLPTQSRSQKRWVLPISILGQTQESVVMSCPDSGSDDNIISLQLVRLLGIPISTNEGDQKEFSLANGKIIRSIGRILSQCNFTRGTPAHSRLDVFFYVFETLAAPIIMGMMFLEATKTFSQYRDRLEEIIVPQNQAFRIHSIGSPRRHLLCRLADDLVFVNADSGADLDLISAEYATRRGFQIVSNQETIMFADGSIETTSGIARLPFSIAELGSSETSNITGLSLSELEFHVFDKLVHNVLVGHETIETHQIFTRHDALRVPGLRSVELSSLNIIRHLKSLRVPGVDRLLGSVRRRLHRNSPEMLHLTALENDDEDQLENARLSAQVERNILLSIDQSSPPESPEYATPEDNLSPVGSVDSPPIVTGQFTCKVPYCTAPPFPTQYLLNAHANIHSAPGPHYCPVTGCPRAEGGKGFKRKNDLIRHGIIHDSPGYVCPFCPNRDHKYPRPDNLQRHVRVHHADKDKDDPLLRDVLAQRPKGPRRRRRRGGP